MGWVLSDIIQFSVSIIQIVWVPHMSICLDKFWIIIFITQFSNFWVMSYENWKHILGVFSFQNSVFNDIFIIKPIYLTAMFDKHIFFFLVKPSCVFEKLRYFKWWVISDENWIMKIEWWQIINQTGPEHSTITLISESITIEDFTLI